VSCLNCKAEEEEDEEDEEAVECIGKVAQSWPSSNTPKGGSEEEREGGRQGGGKFFSFDKQVTEHLSAQGRPDPKGGLHCFWCPNKT